MSFDRQPGSQGLVAYVRRRVLRRDSLKRMLVYAEGSPQQRRLWEAQLAEAERDLQEIRDLVRA